MSLGDKTDCDLSFDKAVIDRSELIRSLEYQYTYLLLCISNFGNDHRNRQILYDKVKQYDVSSFVSTGNKALNLLVNQLGKTAELLHTIKESVTREKIVWE